MALVQIHKAEEAMVEGPWGGHFKFLNLSPQPNVMHIISLSTGSTTFKSLIATVTSTGDGLMSQTSLHT